ncbi:signal peptidase I [Natronobeatus ordinarius]|uniref:signal peptidase I n=1 Tax=Natronobeatus ordinarius TaxID=2963433 RepID=UPI0020CC25D2|nr:signal peptidase I [Natronobeatus ordinarius]
MSGRTILGRLLTIVVVLVLVSLLLGQLLGQPILLGYVATGSMEPTMNAGDGFVAVPSALTGSPAPGDVVVFEARELHDGGLTTHRVVDETDDGYITRGDANPFTDQDAAEPPVTDGQIVAHALQVNGEVVTIPLLGTIVMAVHGVLESIYGAVASAAGLTTSVDGEGMGAWLVGIGVALLGLGFLLELLGTPARETARRTSRENVLAIRVVLAVVLITLVTLATAAMVLPSGVTEYGVVSTTDPTDNPQVLAPGESGTLTRTVENSGLLPAVVAFEPGDGVTADPERVTVSGRDELEATVELTAPEDEGEYVRHLEEHRYLVVLPPTVLVWLHDVHPLVAITAVNGVVVAGAVAAVLALFGAGDLRIRRAGDHVPVSVRTARKLRRFRR